MLKSTVMAEHILRVPLAELTIVRVVCDCGTITEVPLEKLGRLDNTPCPGCALEFSGNATIGRLARLASLQKAILDITSVPNRFGIEFPTRLNLSPGKP